jgi:hypothetical protein
VGGGKAQDVEQASSLHSAETMAEDHDGESSEFILRESMPWKLLGHLPNIGKTAFNADAVSSLFRDIEYLSSQNQHVVES